MAEKVGLRICIQFCQSLRKDRLSRIVLNLFILNYRQSGFIESITSQTYLSTKYQKLKNTRGRTCSKLKKVYMQDRTRVYELFKRDSENVESDIFRNFDKSENIVDVRSSMRENHRITIRQAPEELAMTQFSAF
ncbi:hypothetical protein AVEN_74843-1 [Araneus ventricosus]|uniref:Uncharacterized protein n=1 Tax=Araneus ventricosus TaxID=182803 RepID=A0A4Y2FP19_ARAVE|nr:hypothetical protein AVEN_74843-1 [Araneus ventricosus]